MSNTREVVCPIFGNCTDMPTNQLPTKSDVIMECILRKDRMKGRGLRSPPWKVICEEVVGKIEEIWKSASIPIVHTFAITKKLSTLHSKYENLVKQSQRLD